MEKVGVVRVTREEERERSSSPKKQKAHTHARVVVCVPKLWSLVHYAKNFLTST